MITNKIRERRETLNISALHLAKAAGISAGYLRLVETSHKKPSTTLLFKLAHSLDCKVEDIYRIDAQLVLPGVEDKPHC